MKQKDVDDIKELLQKTFDAAVGINFTIIVWGIVIAILIISK